MTEPVDPDVAECTEPGPGGAAADAGVGVDPCCDDGNTFGVGSDVGVGTGVGDALGGRRDRGALLGVTAPSANRDDAAAVAPDAAVGVVSVLLYRRVRPFG